MTSQNDKKKLQLLPQFTLLTTSTPETQVCGCCHHSYHMKEGTGPFFKPKSGTSIPGPHAWPELQGRLQKLLTQLL